MLTKSREKTVIILIGLISLIWFLIRVIPKPSRATYPCQRAAFPFASAMVIWLTGVFAGKFFLKKTRLSLLNSKYLLVITFFLASIIFFSLITIPFSSLSAKIMGVKEVKEVFVPVDNPNSPIGKAQGIFPGRVVWCYNPDAAKWSGIVPKPEKEKKDAPETDKTDFWYTEGNTIQSEVDYMMTETLCKLTGKNSDTKAWDAIFKHFNMTRGKGAIPYQQGEKVAIKINLNTSGRFVSMTNSTGASPQMVLSLLDQLVNKAKVPAENITIYDVTRVIPTTIFDLCKKDFPLVNFVDKEGGDGKMKFIIDPESQIKWSEDLVLEKRSSPGLPAFLPTCVTESEYLINMAGLKAHTLAGITNCAKNHLGSFISPNTKNMQAAVSAGVHPYIASRDDSGCKKREMNTYNALVDLMGNEHLGGKTLLYLVDALYAARSQGDALDYKCKWNSAPFYGNWTSSLFASLDNVAIESVCLDFLSAEQAVSDDMPYLTGTVDNYLHEAALANNPPSGTKYGSRANKSLKSLGVHEHWNNPVDKKYSRNLKTGEGIELVSLFKKN